MRCHAHRDTAVRMESTAGRVQLSGIVWVAVALMISMAPLSGLDMAAAESLPPNAPDIDFATDVLPILEQRCFQCHADPATRDGKAPKGGLRLDGAGWMLAGGSNGSAIVPGDAGSSPMVRFVSLPANDLDRMPPKGPMLSEDQVQLLREWVTQGAPFGTWRGTGGPVAAAPAFRTGQADAGSHSDGNTRWLAVFAHLEAQAPALREADRVTAEEAGARVEPVVPGSALLRVDFLSRESSVDGKTLAALSGLSNNLAILQLARTSIDDAALEHLAGMQQLVRLDLARTRVTGAGLKSVVCLPELRWLNLFGSDVGDEAVELLAQLPREARLFLWGSQVSDAGVDQLRRARPDLVVQHDLVLPAPEPERDDEDG